MLSATAMHDWTKIIAAGVGPIIVISACGLLCLAFYNRLAAVVTRLRSFHRERLHAHDALTRARDATPPDEFAIVREQELIGMLQVQMDRVGRRARWIQRALACLLLTIGCLAVCSLAIGLSTLWRPLEYTAVVMFVIGLALLVAGVGCALVELQGALDPVDLEGQFVRHAIEQADDAERPDAPADGPTPPAASA
jgi:hypothetical protein